MNRKLLVTLLCVVTFIAFSGCGKSEKEASQEREAEYTIEKKEIQDEKWDKAKETTIDGHPIDAVKGVLEDNKKIQELDGKIQQEQEFQNK